KGSPKMTDGALTLTAGKIVANAEMFLRSLRGPAQTVIECAKLYEELFLIAERPDLFEAARLTNWAALRAATTQEDMRGPKYRELLWTAIEAVREEQRHIARKKTE